MDADALRAAFQEAGFDAEVSSLEPGQDIRDLARRALKERPAILVAAGGDGTVSAMADVVRGTGTALGIVPLGTANHFAKDLGIPLDSVGKKWGQTLFSCALRGAAENGVCPHFFGL